MDDYLKAFQLIHSDDWAQVLSRPTMISTKRLVGSDFKKSLF